MAIIRIIGEISCSYSCTFSRHGKAQTSLALLIWLNENVHIHAPFLAKAMIKQAYHCATGEVHVCENRWYGVVKVCHALERHRTENLQDGVKNALILQGNRMARHMMKMF